MLTEYECTLPSLGPSFMWSSSLSRQCSSLSAGISPPSSVPSLSAYSGLFHFTWLLSIALLIFIIVSPSYLWWLEDDQLFRIKGAQLLHHIHSFTTIFICNSSTQSLPKSLHSAGISMSIKLDTLDITCSSLIPSSAIFRYVLHFTLTSRSGRISLKEWATDILSVTSDGFLAAAKSEEGRSNTQTEHGDQTFVPLAFIARI
ncbi:hypothetical protein CY34DRAFT_283631 [Suillus luteus UH-Slu-Lm8-n1]|uniref:Uncharacterized protein n=1 Tax=Suillus luteus UH-Slu-Lm8-n1 TaxID=930992 RepID=A0A0D0AER5_9AGAM|nr:hypothetical protein CY34DRAFT_283631 [Suillus luteus UH-Slu-Lm8-n1]